MNYNQYDELNSEQLEKVNRMKEDLIKNTFLWSSTPQGDMYWEGVCKNLRKIIESQKPKVDPKKEKLKQIDLLRKQIMDLEKQL